MDSELRSLRTDVEKVKQIPIIQNLLEVVCKTTGMGFAAVARVTAERWMACCVHDEIAFGLKSGEELPIQTTICQEVRHDNQAIAIDHVSQHDYFCNHPTPKLYGFESYISVPILLKNGEFFGTLFAIDPKPALLNNPGTIGMFSLFANLISLHLQNMGLFDKDNNQINNLHRQLKDAQEENRRYQFISNHNLQEPLRHLRMFTTMLIEATEQNENEKAKLLALKIHTKAQRFTKMVSDLSRYSSFANTQNNFEKVDLNQLIQEILGQLQTELKQKSTLITLENLPVIEAVRPQLSQLFTHLIRNAIRFAKPEQAAQIHISVVQTFESELGIYEMMGNDSKFVEICVNDKGVGIPQLQQEKIFDILNPLSYDQVLENRDITLSDCRRIVRSHQGSISVKSEPGIETTFSIILPLTQE
ncbi:ATP-binding protein [Xanthocytophaga agilis]|uniref:histidine kinase n=1 Tax=Xanthocytophaga agilis TaxID=3048010 RepID=A0AAE3RCE5_9BACT|nr:ATP-binding protein [Xanthocytophaga agilis]MDJ1505872.1 ATP-binding protein [Xanthocytophaga agilis]